MKALKLFFQAVLAPVGGIIVALLCSAAGINAVFTYLLRPALVAFYRLIRGTAWVDFIDKILQKLSDFWPPEE